MLPDGKTVLVTVGSVEHPDDYDDATIEAIRLDTGARTTVLKAGRTARYVSPGTLLFLRGKVLYAVPFDAGTLAVKGTPVPVIDGISGDVTTGSAHYAVAKNGTLVFVPGDPSGGNRQLVWVDKQGKVTAIDVEAAHYDGPHVSPDGRRVAVDVVTGASLRDIYIIDTVVGTSSRLTLGGVENRTPIWMHDGHRLVYMAYDRAKNVSAIMIRSADGSGDAQQVAEVGGQAYAEDLTRDDATLVFSANPSTARGKFEIFRVSLQPGSTPEPEVSSPVGDVQNATLSPDGKWLAYYSAESGHPEVFVQSFSSKSKRSQV
jgi:Tol biopolymer transport system component